MIEKFKNFINIAKDKFLENIKFSGLPFVISFLGAIAGSEGASKDYRRIGIPVVFFISALLSTKFNPWVFIILIQHLVLRFGWGIPSFNDEGSLIGRFFYKVCKGNDFWTNFCTRGFIATLLCACFVCIPIVKENWFEFFYCSVGIILTFAFLAWKNLGIYNIKLGNKIYYFCKSDIVCFGVLGILGFKIIF